MVSILFLFCFSFLWFEMNRWEANERMCIRNSQYILSTVSQRFNCEWIVLFAIANYHWLHFSLWLFSITGIFCGRVTYYDRHVIQKQHIRTPRVHLTLGESFCTFLYGLVVDALDALLTIFDTCFTDVFSMMNIIPLTSTACKWLRNIWKAYNEDALKKREKKFWYK